MKSEERHALETNQLATALAGGIERVRPHLTIIGLVAAAVLFALAIGSYLIKSSAAENANAWSSFLQSTWGSDAPAKLAEVAEGYDGQAAAFYSRLAVARRATYEAAALTLVKPEEAAKLRKEAEVELQALLPEADDELLKHEILLALAKIDMTQGEFDEAKKWLDQMTLESYQRVTESFKKRLDEEDFRDSVTWLKDAKLTRPEIPQGPGTPGQPPEFSTGFAPLPGLGGPALGGEGQTPSGPFGQLPDSSLGLPPVDFGNSGSGNSESGMPLPAGDAGAAEEDRYGTEGGEADSTNGDAAESESAGDEPSGATSEDADAAADPDAEQP